MFFHRFYDRPLAQASYLIGCQATGDAIVVDPLRDVAPYLEVAAREGLRIVAVTETHIHADFVSGARELAARTGATLHLSDEGDADWKYAFAATDHAVLLHDGDVLRIGNLRLEVWHTPGHTPEHISFLVTDPPASDAPWGILTGDFVFVGDVGRPDLLEKAAGVADTMVAGAGTLFRSLQRFRTLPDHVQVWPGHGAGSACGKALGAVPSSTVGYERIANWGVATTDEDTFVRLVLEGQPEPPAYFAEMKRINKLGPRILGAEVPVPVAAFDTLATQLAAGTQVVDARPAATFAQGHVPGTIGIPYGTSFSTWAGSLLSYDRDLALIVDRVESAQTSQALRDLRMIGLDRVVAVWEAEAVAAWSAAHGALQAVPQVTPADAVAAVQRGAVTLVDVRGRSEWDAGHIPGALHIPLGALPSRLAELPTDRPIVVQCQSGGRSAVAAGVLQAHGRTDVQNFVGGYLAWRAR